jgi:ABC-type lipoprotein release transport system permease subunit
VTGLYAGVLDGTPTVAEAGMIAAYAVLVMSVCMLACVVPARRALRIEPTEALRVEI